ncbi:MAG: BspA family leucine-rich repeat surface protein, partial [Chitinophagaceae bacterium]|nr:BspA family leucine-rich repeat surface protein [Chitinophagaceae bacterium]
LWAVLLLSTLFQFFGQQTALAGPPQPSMVLQYHIASLPDTAFVPLLGDNNCTIHWGDGSNTIATTPDMYYHVYADTGLYTVTIYGTATLFGRPSSYEIVTDDSIMDNLIRVTNWANLGLTSLAAAFVGAKNLIEVPNYLPSTVTNLSFTFFNASQFNDPNISSWDVSNVDTLFGTFAYATSFNQPLNTWNTANVNYMAYTFAFASLFNQPLNTWNTANVTNMAYTFAYAVSYNQPLNNWNVSKVTDMFAMFIYCFSFNQPLNNWNVSNVTNMFAMFAFDTSFNQNLSMWCVEKIPTTPPAFLVAASKMTDTTFYPKWGQACIPVTCAQPTSVTATPTSNSVTLSFTKAASAQNTQVQFRLKNTGVWGGTSVSGTSHTFTGLSANTTYEYRLRSLCTGSNSSFTTIGEFTTSAATPLPICQAPTGIGHTVNGNTSVTFNWTAANNGALYFVQVKPTASTWAQAGGASTSGTTRTFNNLQAGTSYDYRIRTTCTAATTSNGMSVFSAVGNFATTGNEPGLANFNTANTTWSVYPNPTNDVVNLEFVATEEAPMTIEVLDMAGRKVQEIATQRLMGNNQIQISLSNLNSGLYFIKATQNQEVKALLKVTKQ